MSKYKKIAVLFKERNNDIFEWIVERSEDLDTSMTKFILQCLKKIKKLEDEGEESKNTGK